MVTQRATGARRRPGRRTITGTALALAAAGSVGLGTVQWQAARAADRVPPMGRLVQAKTYRTRTFEDDRIRAYMTFTVNPNGDVNWKAHFEYMGDLVRELLVPFAVIGDRRYWMGCSIVDPFGLILSRYEVSGALKLAILNKEATREWTDHDNPNIKRNIGRITFGPGVVTERMNLRDDGVNYTYDCQLDDRG